MMFVPLRKLSELIADKSVPDHAVPTEKQLQTLIRRRKSNTTHKDRKNDDADARNE